MKLEIEESALRALLERWRGRERRFNDQVRVGRESVYVAGKQWRQALRELAEIIPTTTRRTNRHW